MNETLPIEPSYGSSPNTTYTVNSIAFGDGYTQRVIQGLNSNRRTWSLRWSNLDNADIVRLAAFLNATKGATHFLWTATGDTTPSKWIVSEMRGPDYLEGGRIANLSATIVEVFDL